MAAGYYIRAEAVRAADGTLVCGSRWALVRHDERCGEEVIVDGLSVTDARTLYWRKLEALGAHDAGAPEAADGVAPRQLDLKL